MVSTSLVSPLSPGLVESMDMDGRDSSNPLDLASLTKIDDLWYNDADIVFCAGRTKFRVYRGILSAQSKVFREMLTHTQERVAIGNDSFDVVMLPDDENDVRRFFLAIFDPSYFGPPPIKSNRFAIVSILRLALKYEVSFLIRHAVAQLDSFFPLDKKSLLKRILKTKSNSDPENEKLRVGSSIDTIWLTVEADARWILPSILYHVVSQHSLPDIMGHPGFALLESKLQILIVQFHVQNVLEIDNCNAWVGTLPSETCLRSLDCGHLSRRLQKDDQQRVVGDSSRLFKFDSTFYPDGKTFCRNCQGAGKKYLKESGEMYWNQYPVVCGFQSWDDLKKMRSNWLKGRKVDSGSSKDKVETPDLDSE